MKPTKQTVSPKEVTSAAGNCLAACVASIMEVDINSIPYHEGMCWKDCGEFCQKHGRQLLTYPSYSNVSIKGYHIIIGETDRSIWFEGHWAKSRHAIVAKDGLPYFDVGNGKFVKSYTELGYKFTPIEFIFIGFRNGKRNLAKQR